MSLKPLILTMLISLIASEPESMEDASASREVQYSSADYCLHYSMLNGTEPDLNGGTPMLHSMGVYTSDECKDKKVGQGYYRCCYFEMSKDEKEFYTSCIQLTNEQYHNLGDFYDQIEEGNSDQLLEAGRGYKVEFCDCWSKFLGVKGLIFAIVLLLF